MKHIPRTERGNRGRVAFIARGFCLTGEHRFRSFRSTAHAQHKHEKCNENNDEQKIHIDIWNVGQEQRAGKRRMGGRDERHTHTAQSDIYCEIR